jgi:transposase
VYELTGVRVERIVEEDGTIAIEAAPTASGATCPGCGCASERVHSRYVRTVRDLPACGRPVRVRLKMPALVKLPDRDGRDRNERVAVQEFIVPMYRRASAASIVRGGRRADLCVSIRV